MLVLLSTRLTNKSSTFFLSFLPFFQQPEVDKYPNLLMKRKRAFNFTEYFAYFIIHLSESIVCFLLFNYFPSFPFVWRSQASQKEFFWKQVFVSFLWRTSDFKRKLFSFSLLLGISIFFWNEIFFSGVDVKGGKGMKPLMLLSSLTEKWRKFLRYELVYVSAKMFFLLFFIKTISWVPQCKSGNHAETGQNKWKYLINP